MKFQIGHKINIGRRLSIEHKLAISKSCLGLKKSSISGKNNPAKRVEVRKKISEKLKINNPSFRKEIKEKASKRMKENNPMKLEKYRIKVGLASKGRKLSKEHFDKLQEGRKNTIIPIKDTSIEIKIQNFLKLLGIEFFTHQYISEIRHGYQCDILIPSTKTIIECDGDAFHFNPNKYKAEDKIFKNGMTAKERWELDEIRTRELIEKGFRVIRLWECEIKELNLEDFKIKL